MGQITIFTSPHLAMTMARQRLDELCFSISQITERGDSRLNGMRRVQSLAAALRTLREVSIPMILDIAASDRAVVCKVCLHVRKISRDLSRAEKRDNIVRLITAAASVKMDRDPIAEMCFIDHVDQAVAALKSVEFPRLM